jgi:germination protein M
MSRAVSTPSRWRMALAAVALVTVAGCGVEPEASPRDLPEDERELNVSDPAADTSATGASRVYFIGPGEERLLRSVAREAGSEEELIEILLQGPNEQEVQSQYDTAIPATTELLDATLLAGVLTVNLTSDIEELDTQALIQAISQIVYTASEWDTVDSVQIEVEGQRLSAPTADGNATSQPVRIYDYPNAVVTSQPAFPAIPLTGNA